MIVRERPLTERGVPEDRAVYRRIMSGPVGERPRRSIDVSVVMPAHNEASIIAEQLEALLSQAFDGTWELVVVDNASTDGTAELVAQFAADDDRVTMISAADRADKAYAVNVGAEHSAGDLLVFCDADDHVSQGWLDAMVAGLRSGLVTTGPNELDKLNPPWLASSRGRGIEQPCGSFAGLFPAIRGNNWGIRRSTWDLLGGLSEDCHPCEDAEFSLRCWRAGIEIVGVERAVVHYRYRSDVRHLWRQGLAYGSTRPFIARLLRDGGEPTPPRWAGWKSWAMLMVRFPSIVTSNGRATWVWIAGNRVGQVLGSFRHRILML